MRQTGSYYTIEPHCEGGTHANELLKNFTQIPGSGRRTVVSAWRQIDASRLEYIPVCACSRLALEAG